MLKSCFLLHSLDIPCRRWADLPRRGQHLLKVKLDGAHGLVPIAPGHALLDA